MKPIQNTHTTPQHTAQLPKNTDTMISPARGFPAAPILKVSAIAVCRTIDLDLRNTAMQFFSRETNCFFILLPIIQ